MTLVLGLAGRRTGTGEVEVDGNHIITAKLPVGRKFVRRSRFRKEQLRVAGRPGQVDAQTVSEILIGLKVSLAANHAYLSALQDYGNAFAIEFGELHMSTPLAQARGSRLGLSLHPSYAAASGKSRLGALETRQMLPARQRP